MPSTLHKTRKQISKKRNGAVNALHEKSRDSMRLHKASVRDQRLEKLASARSKREQPIVDRVAFFQEGLNDRGGDALEISVVQEMIETFLQQFREEHDELKKARRANRPATAREDLLKIKIAALETEYKQGFALPEITTADGANKLQGWEGAWPYLTTLTWIKISADGNSRAAEFPSKGLN